MNRQTYWQVLVLGVCWMGSVGFAQTSDPAIGLWKTIDDETKEATSIVRVQLVQGRLEGHVVQVLAEPKDAICERCTDERKNKPVLGMKIMSGLTLKKPGEWGGGDILDPDNGKTYRVHLAVHGDRMVVRGYIGVPLFGREQIWLRVAN